MTTTTKSTRFYLVTWYEGYTLKGVPKEKGKSISAKNSIDAINAVKALKKSKRPFIKTKRTNWKAVSYKHISYKRLHKKEKRVKHSQHK